MSLETLDTLLTPCLHFTNNIFSLIPLKNKDNIHI